jgi:hypothetical protein
MTDNGCYDKLPLQNAQLCRNERFGVRPRNIK